ncbi:hypothetical protein ACTI_05400 [Actinoplanes sp. OR16]|nr:hypothetical protein ACTI_05400 [Actinoplanes sp. OR16]
MGQLTALAGAPLPEQHAGAEQHGTLLQLLDAQLAGLPFQLGGGFPDGSELRHRTTLEFLDRSLQSVEGGDTARRIGRHCPYFPVVAVTFNSGRFRSQFGSLTVANRLRFVGRKLMVLRGLLVSGHRRVHTGAESATRSAE